MLLYILKSANNNNKKNRFHLKSNSFFYHFHSPKKLKLCIWIRIHTHSQPTDKQTRNQSIKYHYHQRNLKNPKVIWKPPNIFLVRVCLPIFSKVFFCLFVFVVSSLCLWFFCNFYQKNNKQKKKIHNNHHHHHYIAPEQTGNEPVKRLFLSSFFSNKINIFFSIQIQQKCLGNHMSITKSANTSIVRLLL